MKKIRSKKGMSLVELVVTVAILGMVSTLGVGMVSSAIQNYSVASKTSMEQDTSLAIESFITEGTRIYGLVDVKENIDPQNGVADEGKTAFYIYFDKSDNLVTLRSNMSEGKQSLVEMKYEGVKQVYVRPKKQKPTNDGSTSEKSFVFVEYQIDMNDGYSLHGTAVMNNASNYTDVNEESNEESKGFTINATDTSLIDEGNVILIYPKCTNAIVIAE